MLLNRQVRCHVWRREEYRVAGFRTGASEKLQSSGNAARIIGAAETELSEVEVFYGFGEFSELVMNGASAIIG